MASVKGKVVVKDHMERWRKDAVALVTGASSGIGAAICKELVEQGMIVIGCARRVDTIRRMAEVSDGPGRLHPMKCDLTSKEEIKAMFVEIREKFKRIDVCINSAGCGKNSSLTTGLTVDWKQMLDVNILGLCICTQESLKLMKETKIDGIIIHIGSVVGHKVPHSSGEDSNAPTLGLYYGTKFMVRGLAESLRQELKLTDSKIKVATISPGAVETEFFGKAVTEELARVFYSYYQCLRPEEIAAQVINVLNTEDFVNVQDIIVQPRSFRM